MKDWELLEQDKRKFNEKYCILSTESQKTLRVFRIKDLSLVDLVKAQSYFKLKLEDDSILNLLSKEYSYVISRVCSDVPFHKLDICCYECRSGYTNGCIQSRTEFHLWVWKPCRTSDVPL